MPRIDPTGERLFLPYDAPQPPLAAVPGAAPAAAQWGISVSPSQVIAPVGSEVVMIASVCGADGFMLTRQRVEWMLAPDGVGQFMSPGQRPPLDILDWMHGLPKKVDNRFVVNTTLTAPMTLDRGTPAPTDDVLIQSGQSWVSVTSPNEGTSRVTVFAPEIYGWDRRQQTASIYWVDAQWRFPPPAITPVGSRHSLVTTLTRQTDHSPLPGWLVRYEISGGPEAGFAPDGATSLEVVTGAGGEAPVELFQKQPVAGTNQITIQIIRPANLAGQTRPLTLGAGSTLHTWTATAVQPAPPSDTAPPTVSQPSPETATLDVTLSGPETATVGSDVNFEIDVVNRGSGPATGLLVSNRFDAGLQHAVSASPIERDLADLPPGGAARLNVTFRVTRAGELCQEITVTGAGGLRATARRCIAASEPAAEQPLAPAQPPATTEPSLPAQPPADEPQTPSETAATGAARISLKMTGPDRRQVGETALFSIEVTNQGGQPIDNLEVADHFETTLQPLRATEESTWLEAGALGWKIASLEPGKTIRRAIEFTCLRDTPKSCNRVTVTAPGLESKSEEACLEIVGTAAKDAAPADNQAPLAVSVAETADPIKVGGETTYQVLVTNKASESVFDVAVTVTFGDEIRLEEATAPLPERPKILPGEVRFPATREIRSGENPLSFELKCKGMAAGTARLHVEVTSRGQATPLVANETTEVLPP